MKASYEYRRENNAFILTLQGDLIGDETGPQLLEVVSDAINDKLKFCIVNLSGVRYISSSGIGVLITMLTKMRNAGGEVLLVSPSEHVKKLLIITKLNNIFIVYENLGEALQHANPNS